MDGVDGEEVVEGHEGGGVCYDETDVLFEAGWWLVLDAEVEGALLGKGPSSEDWDEKDTNTPQNSGAHQAARPVLPGRYFA